MLETILISLIYAGVFNHKVNVAWDAPTTNTDGSPLTDLKGYKIYCTEPTTGYYGEGSFIGNYTSGEVASPYGTVKTCKVTAVNKRGIESSPSNELTITF